MNESMQIPATQADLITRAQTLAGQSLGELAEQLGMTYPQDPRQAKGWVGVLIERYLGAYAGPSAQPDFPHLGIELKTLPLNHQGKPKESTYVCVAELQAEPGLRWKDSLVCQKLSQVLWVGYQAERDIPWQHRCVIDAFLWQPSEEDRAILRQDWEEAMEFISFGRLDEVRSQYGQYLQIRPKAADAQQLTTTVGPSGEAIRTLPRGFYLRTSFTHRLWAMRLQ